MLREARSLSCCPSYGFLAGGRRGGGTGSPPWGWSPLTGCRSTCSALLGWAGECSQREQEGPTRLSPKPDHWGLPQAVPKCLRIREQQPVLFSPPPSWKQTSTNPAGTWHRQSSSSGPEGRPCQRWQVLCTEMSKAGHLLAAGFNPEAPRSPKACVQLLVLEALGEFGATELIGGSEGPVKRSFQQEAQASHWQTHCWDLRPHL